MYNIEFEKSVIKDFKKLDVSTKKYIMVWIRKNLDGINDPRLKGKALVGDKRGYWRYRIADYRLITKIDDGKLKIIAIQLGHRKDIYNK
ncbi:MULTISPECIES: type II toxin-antitoxin system RelE/ParE family toxin [unclassified Gemella]|uniref:type II toxin-antitoxin system RelE family toxin n=1 Tax=unclassified Gemella TaxID=2624949 RepID=UPI0015D006D1|nr:MULTISPECIES: type II toxin-antitoxin system RelE/ParE family toxin [unclassified Gemella]MBF0710566.1 type II toxin-antitoxin system RelE/ParE family toxin [Gemella sp. GL1.1]NYS27910.1 type II toxin-antitoxin system RelE/ParE family toxin [Gemella sp. GL1]